MSLPPSFRGIQPSVPPRVVSWLGEPMQAVAFWAAIALPVAYLPLFTVDIGWFPSWTGFALLGLNMVALVVGHPHGR